MRICFVADLRSPTARAFIELAAGACEVHAIDLRDPDRAVQGPIAVPSSSGRNERSGMAALKNAVLSNVPYASIAAIDWLQAQRVRLQSGRLAAAIEAVRPDIVHALRIPFEGVAAAAACRSARLVVSVWGNDFTLHCAASGTVRRLTAQALARADGLLADCQRDVRLAGSHGFAASKPSLVVPGSGGIDASVFFPPPDPDTRDARLIVNTRGTRAYVRTDNFIRAIPLVLERVAGARFAAVGLAGHRKYERLARGLGVQDAIEMLPKLPQSEIASLYRKATLFVSPSEHDGTPNTLLEAMACGVVPVVGGLEPLREWITDSVNGVFCDPASPESIAAGIVKTLGNADLQERARTMNLKLVAERASRKKSRLALMEFYERVTCPSRLPK